METSQTSRDRHAALEVHSISSSLPPKEEMIRNPQADLILRPERLMHRAWLRTLPDKSQFF